MDNFKLDLQETGWGMNCTDLIRWRDKWRALWAP